MYEGDFTMGIENIFRQKSFSNLFSFELIEIKEAANNTGSVLCGHNQIGHALAARLQSLDRIRLPVFGRRIPPGGSSRTLTWGRTPWRTPCAARYKSLYTRRGLKNAYVVYILLFYNGGMNSSLLVSKQIEYFEYFHCLTFNTTRIYVFLK